MMEAAFASCALPNARWRPGNACVRLVVSFTKPVLHVAHLRPGRIRQDQAVPIRIGLGTGWTCAGDGTEPDLDLLGQQQATSRRCLAGATGRTGPRDGCCAPMDAIRAMQARYHRTGRSRRRCRSPGRRCLADAGSSHVTSCPPGSPRTMIDALECDGAPDEDATAMIGAA